MKPVLSSFFLTICLFGIISASATVFGQSTAPNRTIRNTGSCGVPIRPSGFIVHGQEFPRGDFPWIVALMHKSRPPSFFCSGTLVSSNYVISAAHCIQQKESKKPLLPREVVALFGAHDLNDPYETEKIALSPSKIYIHDDWNPFNTNYDADISILEFENGKISFNERSAYIQPICLWDSPAEPPGSKGTVTGWGKSEDTTKIHENIPKKLEVEIQTNEDCFFSSDSLIQLSSKRTFCAGLQNGSGVCFGDSGSGLFVNVNGVAYLKGIVSSSLVTATKNCDVSRNAVYTDVLAFRDWINKITGLHALSSASVKEVECHFDENIWTYFNKKINCCWIESRVIDSEHAVLNAPRDDSVLGFDARSNKNVKFLPGNIGEKFPKLEGLAVWDCALTVLREKYFEGLRNLKYLNLAKNEISIVEKGAFKDLTSLDYLGLDYNKIQTLDARAFETLINLTNAFLNFNQIKSLNPNTFDKCRKLTWLDLSGSVCINKYYFPNSFDAIKADLTAKCASK